MEGFAIFTDFKDGQGKFGVGKIPEEIQQNTGKLCKLFYEEIPKDKLQDKTYHKWFDNFSPEIKSMVTSIQNNSFWNEMCTGTHCKVISVPEMNELYYSKVPAKRDDLFLYGASSNYDPHVDGFFGFPGVKFYRVLIGLTPNNEKVETRFLKFGIHHKLQKDDYLVFDFDNAEHQVVNNETDPDKVNKDYRIMLKLHFIVCDDCQPDDLFIKGVKQSYILYEIITRYFMQTGTNPSTLYGFILGIVDMVWHKMPFIALICFIAFWMFPLAFLWKKNVFWKRWLLTVNVTWLSIVLAFATVLWIRYILTGKR
jgi:hypothetical protein